MDLTQIKHIPENCILYNPALEMYLMKLSTGYYTCGITTGENGPKRYAPYSRYDPTDQELEDPNWEFLPKFYS